MKFLGLYENTSQIIYKQFIRHLTQIEWFCLVSSECPRRLKCEVNPSLPSSAEVYEFSNV
jgi:hypothetical protein